MRTLASDNVGENRLSILPKVDFLGDAREGGLKVHRKQTNLSVIWTPHPTYDGKKITSSASNGKVYLVAPVEIDMKEQSKKCVDPFANFFKA